MNPPVNYCLGIVLAYLFGAVPTAYIFGRLIKKIDIRQHGSGNVGATNAFRILGKGPGTCVLVIDVFKGVIATAGVSSLLHLNEPYWQVILGLVAVCGHNWTVFLNFKGGKGIATSLGVLIGLTIAIESIRIVVGLTFLAWLVIFLASGYVSLASIVASVVFPVITLVYPQPFAVIIMAVVLCVFVVLRHRSNITRLLERKESQVKFPWHKRK